MRRMLSSVAVLAAALLAPTAASATLAPVLSGPATSNAPAPAAIHLTWTDVNTQPGVVQVTYDVLRSLLNGANCPATPTGTSDLSGGLVDTLAYDDVLSASDQGTYCYYVEANDGATGAADSDPL